ncbi:MAG: cytochrome c oxidase subunit 3 [Alphaproteobacteria bacterium]|nr:cytochrome c oxidase subunit 3 [Alphaproteobacteria bacterium]|tara:strand:- start:298 stop:1215 length:918 start_codon:yes stop_codon:yes gene_type:complete
MAEEIEYTTTGKPHPYHLVNPSIWPLMGAVAGGIFASGMVMYMHGAEIAGTKIGLFGPILGVLAILAVMFFWWKDVIHESVVEKAHTAIASIGFRYGMLLFIASEVMFFVAFFWAFFDASLFAGEARQFLRVEYTSGIWPPPQITIIEPFDLPFMMTMILLLSGTTVTWAHHAILEGKQEEMAKALGITVLLGVIFLGFQAYEYQHAEFGFKDGIYPSAFYMATGFHGFHVLVGTIFLAVCWLRALQGHFTKEHHFGFEAAAWYWHFVDVVWLFLFVAIYWWGNKVGMGDASALAEVAKTAAAAH